MWCPGRRSASPLLGRWAFLGAAGWGSGGVSGSGHPWGSGGDEQPLPLSQVVCYVNMNLMDASVQPRALRLLESVTLSSPALAQLVKSEVTLDRLLVHLQV